MRILIFALILLFGCKEKPEIRETVKIELIDGRTAIITAEISSNSQFDNWEMFVLDCSLIRTENNLKQSVEYWEDVLPVNVTIQ